MTARRLLLGVCLVGLLVLGSAIRNYRKPLTTQLPAHDDPPPTHRHPSDAPRSAARSLASATPHNASAAASFALPDFTQILDHNLLAVGPNPPTAAESAALIALATDFTRIGGPFAPATAARIGEHLAAFPGSPYALSLLQEKAAIEWRHGFFTASLASIAEAAALALTIKKAAPSPDTIDAHRLADTALSTHLLTLSRVGDREALRAALASLGDHTLGGLATEAVYKAKEQLWFFDHQAEQNVFCGFTAANSICVPVGYKPIHPDVHDEAERQAFIRDGLSLLDLRAHSHEADGDLQIIKASASPLPADLPVPSIIHFKFGHYSAITERDGDLYRVKDVHLKYDSWVPLAALVTDGSGYFLASASTAIPSGFSAIPDEEARTIYGRHCVHGRDPEGEDKSTAGNGSVNPEHKTGCPMAVHSFRLVNPGLEIQDTPISYQAPYGPGVDFTLKYDQRSTVILDLAAHANFGPRWTYDYLGYVDLAGTGTPNTSVSTVFGNGSYYRYTYSTATASYVAKYQNHPKLDYLAPAAGGPGYRLRFPDGREWLYTLANSATPTRFYLTSIRDPRGNALTYSYDAALRLTSLTDALGQATTFSYTPAADDLFTADSKRIRAITDPFGRSASFRYTATGLLHKVIDPVGIVSEFRYAATGDFIDRLTTPYGSHTYTWGDLPGINQEPGRFVEATDPAGDKERVEANDLTNYPNAAGTDPYPAPTSITVASQAVPFLPKTDNLHYRNTFYWDKKQMKEGSGDYSKAMLYNWKAENNIITAVIGSAQMPLQGRVWYSYPGQTSDEGIGNHQSPAKIVRAVEQNGTLVWTMAQAEYDATWGLPSRTVDPLGRETRYEYNDANNVSGAIRGLDLTAIKVKNGAAFETIATFSDFEFRQPRTVTDAAGQITRYTYNSAGQPLTVTNPKGEITTFAYYAADAVGKKRKGRLERIDGALAGTADTTTLDYDSAGRVARITGPDGYALDYAYDNIDRLTRITYPDTTYTETIYQNLNPVSSRDRLGRLTTYVYNSILQLSSVTDPANRTIQYKWCKCGDLQQLIDALGRVTKWRHDVAGRVTAKEYADGSSIAYAFEPLSGRLASVTDEKNQVKTLAYHLDGALAKVGYLYETHETPDVSYTYDPVYGRLASMTDGLGTTIYGYHPVAPGTLGAGQLASVDGPWANDTLTYLYDPLGRLLTRAVNSVAETAAFDAAGRLETITNALGSFTYAYEGVTSRLSSTTHSGGQKAAFKYFPAVQDFRLERISNLKADGTTPLSIFDYTYDAHGRILTWKQQQDSAAASAQLWTLSYDNADQLTSQVVTQGATTVDTYEWGYDAAANRTSETINGATTTATHNALNELITTTAAVPEMTYEWDAEDRLLAINQGVNRSEFTYDGQGRRVRITEKTNGTVTSTHSYLWDGLQIRERRDAGGATVQQRYFGQGFQGVTGTPTGIHLYSRDHLGSIREATDTSGILKERINYGAWGQILSPASTAVSSFTYTGHLIHRPSSLYLAPYRAYSPSNARWLSRDLIEENGGINLYSYTQNNPISIIDLYGLFPIEGAILNDVVTHTVNTIKDTANSINQLIKAHRQSFKARQMEKSNTYCPKTLEAFKEKWGGAAYHRKDSTTIDATPPGPCGLKAEIWEDGSGSGEECAYSASDGSYVPDSATWNDVSALSKSSWSMLYLLPGYAPQNGYGYTIWGVIGHNVIDTAQKP